MKGTSLALPLLALSCVEFQSNPVSIPPGVDWLVLVEFDALGVFRRAVGPVPAEAPLATTVRTSEAVRRLVLGYGDAEILALAPELSADEIAARAAREPPRASTGCDPQLPAPVFVQKLEGGQWRSSEESPLLTAGWLFDRCPEETPELWFDLSECASPWCLRDLLPKGRCGAEVSFPGCQLSPLEVFRERGGGLCALGVEQQPVRELHPGVLLEDGFGGSCTVWVATPEVIRPRIQRWSFAEFVPDLEPAKPRQLVKRSSHSLSSGTPFGNAADFVLLGDQIVISTARAEPESCFEQPTLSTGLVRFRHGRPGVCGIGDLR